MTHGHIYFAGYGDVVKIGKSVGLKKRLTNLNGANPNRVLMYVSVETFDMVGLESRMHKHFIACRRPGKREWYNVTSELQYVIASLMQMNAPTEFDLGKIFGQYESYKQAHDAYQHKINSLQRTVALAEHRQIEQWAQSYAIGAMKFAQYPAYKFRYNEAMEYFKTLEAGEVPVFITDQFSNLVIPQDNIDTQAA